MNDPFLLCAKHHFIISRSYSKRALQCNQAVVGKFILIALQLVLDLRGIDRNVYPILYEGSTEDSVLATAQRKNDIQFCRAICIKKKYKAFLLGNMTVAAEMYELYQKLPVGSNGESMLFNDQPRRSCCGLFNNRIYILSHSYRNFTHGGEIH